MKTLINPKNLIAYLAVFLITLFFSGCTTPEKTAYRSIATVSVMVDNSMKAWGSWVAQGKATPADEVAVKKAYQVYQASMRTAKIAITSINSSPSGQSDLNIALNAVAASAFSIVQLIQTITQKP